MTSHAACVALARQEVLVHNHDQKCKDIAESILPSKARVRARKHRRQMHGRERAAVRTALGHSDWDVRDAQIADAVGRTKRELRDVVLDRRMADKDASLVRWALRRVERDPELRDAHWRVQLAAFEAMFTSNLIGRHALDHIEWALRYPCRISDR